MARLNKQKRPGFHRESLTLTNGVKPFRSADKADESKELEDQVQKFLDQGGKIEQVEEGASKYQPIRNRKQVKVTARAHFNNAQRNATAKVSNTKNRSKWY
tara:strand:+ start:147 stop:449 length:303 start_codon:yes stop_codon:yes gene_type:complete